MLYEKKYLVPCEDYVLELERSTGFYESQIDYYDGEVEDKSKMIQYAKLSCFKF